MKKKIYRYLTVAVIAVAMVVGFQMSKANSATTLTMENVEALAMADGVEHESESDCIPSYTEVCIWDDGYCKSGTFL